MRITWSPSAARLLASPTRAHAPLDTHCLSHARAYTAWLCPPASRGPTFGNTPRPQWGNVWGFGAIHVFAQRMMVCQAPPRRHQHNASRALNASSSCRRKKGRSQSTWFARPTLTCNTRAVYGLRDIDALCVVADVCGWIVSIRFVQLPHAKRAPPRPRNAWCVSANEAARGWRSSA